jgi:thioredoxin 1
LISVAGEANVPGDSKSVRPMASGKTEEIPADPRVSFVSTDLDRRHRNSESRRDPINATSSAAFKGRPTGKVEHVGEDDFEPKVLDSSEPVLVDFYADWCGPCRKLAPVLDRLARETPGARVVKVNIDRSPRLARAYRVNSIPTLLVFKEGRPVAREEGWTDQDTLQSLLTQ